MHAISMKYLSLADNDLRWVFLVRRHIISTSNISHCSDTAEAQAFFSQSAKIPFH